MDQDKIFRRGLIALEPGSPVVHAGGDGGGGEPLGDGGLLGQAAPQAEVALLVR